MKKQNVSLTLRLLCALSAVAIAACAGNADYRFADHRGRACFAPCASSYTSCRNNCTDRLMRRNGLLGVLSGISCGSSCESARRRCAWSCGGWRRDTRNIHVAIDTSARHRLELRKKLRLIRYSELSGAERSAQDSRCAALYDTAHAQSASPKACGSRDQAIQLCRELSSEATRCFDGKTYRAQPARCDRTLRKEHAEAVRALRDHLSSCLAAQTLASREKPAPAPRRAPAAPQARDTEHPPR